MTYNREELLAQIAALMARRLKARMGAGGEAGRDSCNGLNTSCPEGCEREDGEA